MELGEKANDQKVVGYACAWLPFTCGELGLFAKGIEFGERAQKIAESFHSDQYLFFKSLAGLCFIYFYMGDTHRIFEGAKRLFEYGERYTNNRSRVFGSWIEAFGQFTAGDIKSSQKSNEKAIAQALDPFYAYTFKSSLGLVYLYKKFNFVYNHS